MNDRVDEVRTTPSLSVMFTLLIFCLGTAMTQRIDDVKESMPPTVVVAREGYGGRPATATACTTTDNAEQTSAVLHYGARARDVDVIVVLNATSQQGIDRTLIERVVSETAASVCADGVSVVRVVVKDGTHDVLEMRALATKTRASIVTEPH